MDSSDEFPPVPPPPLDSLVERGLQWRWLWELAHREMAPFDRRPSPYLIDRLCDPKYRYRRWLVGRLGLIAQVTREREFDNEQSGGALAWETTFTDPSCTPRRVRILMNAYQGWIFNAYPID
jgi:hypothetical protein